MQIIYLASSVLSLFFILLLTAKKNKSISDKILVAWFVLLFSNVTTFYLIINDLASLSLVEFLNISVFLHGPLLYFYTLALTGNPRRAIKTLKKAALKGFRDFEFLENDEDLTSLRTLPEFQAILEQARRALS